MSASEDSEGDQGIHDFASLTQFQSAQVEPTNVGSDGSENAVAEDDVLLRSLDNGQDSDGDFSPPSNSDDGSEEQKPNPRDSRRKSHVPDDDAILEDLVYEESYYTRPNRYHGPASTWRTWTAEDRAVVAELDSERARDLCIHLYNAHVLNASAKNLNQKSDRKRRRGTSESGEEEHVFRPPKMWTAWPLPVGEVPRDVIGSDGRDCRPSKELEECLITATMRVARERWNARDWSGQVDFEQHGKVEDKPSQQDGGIDSPSLTREASEDENILPRPMFSSQAFDSGFLSSEGDSDASSGANSDGLAGENARPVTLADDDKADRLLIPSTRHVISNLDNLLMGLHRARQTYAMSSVTGFNNSTLTSSSGRSRTGRVRGRERSQRRPALSESAAESEAKDPPVIKGTKTMGSDHKELSTVRRERLALRDWTEVLGMASLTGWDQEVVNRASGRCAKLFGENMLFRTFHEGAEDGGKSHFVDMSATGDEPPMDYDTRNISDPSHMRSDDDSDRSVRSEHPCPHQACPRHTTPFKTYGILRAHLRQHHMNFGEEDIKPPAATLSSDTSAAARSVFCPIKTCHRHQTPFSKGSRLYAHVRKMHPEVNVESLKKLEAQRRGETRGRWADERRRRNPYERSSSRPG